MRIPPELRDEAAARLIRAPLGDRHEAGRRLIRSAGRHGIDLDLLFGIVDPDRGDVREVCLAVPGAGRTAMLFVSGPRGGKSQGHNERIGAVRGTLDALASQMADRVRISQALPEPDETWACRAYAGAGMIRIGELDYLQLVLRSARGTATTGKMPTQVTMEPLASMDRGSAEESDMVEALDRSYEQTLDCPELCGMRETRDVLESHRSTGVFEPSLWWIARLEGAPHGCMLLSALPDRATVELVYLGLSPRLRGLGVGAALLSRGIEQLRRRHHEDLTCAVDRRNAPAHRLYRRFGFRRSGSRVAYVLPVERPPRDT